MVAALFVESGGTYFGLPGVDPWDEARDARRYAGPFPVVAHPPCQRYGNLGVANFARWGGEHNRPLNDSGCFAAALAAVNCWGGVLEHPAFSMAWPIYNLERPPKIGWGPSGAGWVCEVWQAAYGHAARKRTWLYYRGEREPPILDWSRPTGTCQVGFQDQRGKQRNLPTLGKREANATPLEFRDVLLGMARNAVVHAFPAML